MPASKAVEVATISLAPSERPIVHGCPGVPASLPRIDTTIQLRSARGAPFVVRLVLIELRTIQKVSIPSKIGLTDSFREYKLLDELVYRPLGTSFGQELLGLDIPVLFSLPGSIPASTSTPSWTALTCNFLWVIVALGDSAVVETVISEKFAVPVKLYDTLPLYRQYNSSLEIQKLSADDQVVVDIEIPHSSVGPQDLVALKLSVFTNIKHNNIKKHLKLKLLTMQIKEIMECHEGGIAPRRENKLYTSTKDFSLETSGGVKLTSTPIVYEFKTIMPNEDDLLVPFEDLMDNTYYENKGNIRDDTWISSANIHRYTFLNELEDGTPIVHTQGFTGGGKFYSMRYEIVIKVKLSKSKDMDIRIPLTVSPFNRISCKYLLEWIYRECDVAKYKFGKEAITWLYGKHFAKDMVNEVIKRQGSLPVVYLNNRNGWRQLGYGEDASGKRKQDIFYID